MSLLCCSVTCAMTTINKFIHSFNSFIHSFYRATWHVSLQKQDFWETLPLIWALSAFSVNARFRPSPPPRPPPANPTALWLVTFLEARTRAGRFDQAYGGAAGVPLRRWFPGKWEQVNRKRCPECLALCTDTPDCQQGIRQNACMSLFDTLVWLNMTINHYNNVYRS